MSDTRWVSVRLLVFREATESLCITVSIESKPCSAASHSVKTFTLGFQPADSPRQRWLAILQDS